jgi:erythromycin esterase
MKDTLDWIRRKAIPIATVEPGNGFADLGRLRAIIGNARIVSLGEATHGTREFFQLKHRLFEYCVSELGFTIFAIEANFPECLRVNDYVLHGTGNPAQALAGMRFWIWDTQEVLDLIEWIRTWNITHDRKLKFYGFDMTYPTEAALGVIDYLKRVAPDLAATSEVPLWPLSSDFSASQFHLLVRRTRERTLSGVENILEAFARERSTWSDKTSEYQWQVARLHAIVLNQGARLRLDASANQTISRDVAMAENVASLLEIEGTEARAILWAHNGHAARETPYFTDEKTPIPNMGSRLHEIFGQQQLVVGFAFNQGLFQARNTSGEVVIHRVSPASKGSLDNILASTGMPLFLLELATMPADASVSDWFATSPTSRWIGAVHNPKSAEAYQYGGDPRRRYDVLAFVESTTATRPNPTGRRPPQSDHKRGPTATNLELNGAGPIPEGWSTPEAWHPYGYAVALTDEQSPADGRVVCIARSSAPWPWGEGELLQAFSADDWHGKRLRFSAAVRAGVQKPGCAAQLCVKVLPKAAEGEIFVAPTHIAMLDPPVRSSRWERFAVEIDISNEAYSIVLALVFSGDGAAWFADIQLEPA